MKQSGLTSRGGHLAGFGLVVLLLVGSAAVSYLNARLLREDSWAVEQTHLVLEALDNVQLAVVDAETGQRGFLLTGEKQYLEPYTLALATIERRVARLDSLTESQSHQQDRLRAINRAIEAKLVELAETLRLYASGGFDAAQQLVKQDSGKREMDVLRDAIREMKDSERAALEQRTLESRTTFQIAVLSGLMSAILGVAAVIMLGHHVHRSYREREQSAQRLGEESEKLEITLKSIGDGVITTDTKGKVTMMNHAAESLTGWSMGDALGQPLEHVFHIVQETSGKVVENPALQAMSELKIVGLANHTVLIAKDGTRCAISDSAAPIHSAKGELLGSVLVFRDVSAKRDFERGVDFHNRLLSLTIDVGNALGSGESFSDSLQRCCEALIDHVKGAIARIWTYDPVEQLLHLQASAGSVVRPNDPHKTVQLGKYKIGRIAETRRWFHVNWLVGDPMFPDQQWVKQEGLVSFAGYPLVVGDRLVGVMAFYARHELQKLSLEIMGAIAQDIAVGIDRQRMIAEDRENRRLLEVTLESIGEAVLTTDAEGRITFMNQVAQDVSGWTAAEALGKTFEKIILLDLPDGIEGGVNLARNLLIDGKRADSKHHVLLHHKQGHDIPVEYNGAPIIVDNHTVGVVLVFRNVSEQLKNQHERELLLERVDNERLLLESVLEALPAGVIIADAKGRLTHINGALKKIWGDATPMSQGIDEYGEWKGWWPETGQRIEPNEWAMARALMHGEICPGEEVVIERFDGETATIINSASPIRDSTGTIIGGVVAEVDITELTDTQAALRDTRARLNALLEAGELGTWEWDIANDLVFADQNLESIFGIEQSTAEGVPLNRYLSSVYTEDRERVDAALRQAAASSERLEVDYRITAPKGSVRWMVARGRVEEDSSGKPTRLAGMVVDVTERRKAELALEDSRKFLEETLDALPSHVAVLDDQGVILIVNRAWREFAIANDYQGDTFGVASSYLESCQEVGHGEASRIGSDAAVGIRRVLAGELLHFHWEYACQAPGEQRWFMMSVNPFNSSSGLRVIVSHEDITSRVLAEQSVRESEERFRTLADNMSQFSWMADADGSIFWYNKRWFDYTGTTLDEMQGWGWTKVHHPDHVDRVVKKIQHCWDSGELWEDTFPLRGKDGEYRWFLSRANPIYDDSGKIVRWFGTNTDITEHRELEQALLDADQRKDHFLATLGHELRNPLAGILGGIEVLESAEPDSKEQFESQQIIMRQVRFMERLVDDLLDVSRIVRGKVTLRKELVDLRQMVEEVVNDAFHGFVELNIRLSSWLPEQPVYCRGDRERLRQVFTNLLHNARKFTEAGGSVQVELRLSVNEDFVEFIVSDTGIGMTESTQNSIFQPFLQADVSLGRTRGGLGLGLSIVRGLVELHSGSVDVKSHGLGQGSTFVVSLPVVQDAIEARTVELPVEKHSNIGALNVLVVDDRRDASYPLVRFLKQAGHSVQTAVDGPGAVDAALRLRPDVILCDIGLPVFDGYEVARRLRAEEGFGEALMIAVTGYGQPHDKSNAEAAGFDAHLVKPVDRNELIDAIESWAIASGKVD